MALQLQSGDRYCSRLERKRQATSTERGKVPSGGQSADSAIAGLEEPRASLEAKLDGQQGEGA